MSYKSYFHGVVKIGRHRLGEGHPCFVIAEAGSNHNRRWDLARKLVRAAAQARADAVKFQVFVPEKIYVQDAGCADYLGKKKTIRQIFEEIAMPRNWIQQLARHCARAGILFLASVFDEEAADQVDPFVPAHKIASYESTHLPLLKYVAKKKKPIILSAGLASLDEIAAALETIASAGNRDVVLMHCVAKYPAPVEATNLRVIDTLRQLFHVPVGLSDHSRGLLINPVAAAARGANILEKHFTLSNNLPGPDHRFALEPGELAALVAAVRQAESALGSPIKKVLPIEKELFAFARRRVHATRDIRKGETFTHGNTAVLRSGKKRPGLEPCHYERLMGKHAARDIKRSDGIRACDVEEKLPERSCV